MLFDALLFSADCLLMGQTSYGENKSRVSLKTESEETILFFRTDSNTFRRIINATNEKVCDLVILYANQNRRVICFCELKGSQVNDAKEQIINTHRLLMQYFTKQNLFLSLESKAIIVPSGSFPKDTKKIREELANTVCSSTQNVDICRSREIGDFLRGATQKSDRKGKKKNRKNRST
ncbi:MAG: hypothetical protein AAGG51_15310 [Cyanobacteria bacterium P01_G01_bin.54]